MKLRSLCLGLAGLLCLWFSCLPLHAQTTQAVYAPFLGRWKGSLTYRDYSSDKMVTLPTVLEITLTPDAKMLRQHYWYDDGPGKQLEETENVVVDPAKSTYAVLPADGKNSHLYAVSGLAAFAQKGGGVLVLAGTGEDNGKKAEIRNTITRSADTLTILHETRLPGEAYRFRNRFQFTRMEKAAPAVTRLTATQLQADFAVCKKAYQELHHGLYCCNTPAQMEGHFQTLKNTLDHDETLSEAYLAATFLATIKCGHSYLNFYN